MSIGIAKGDRININHTPGYVLVQSRPYKCRPVCTCGDCNGRSVNYPGTVEGIIRYGDGAIDAEVLCDDGVTRRKEIRPCNLD